MNLVSPIHMKCIHEHLEIFPNIYDTKHIRGEQFLKIDTSQHLQAEYRASLIDSESATLQAAWSWSQWPFTEKTETKSHDFIWDRMSLMRNNFHSTQTWAFDVVPLELFAEKSWAMKYNFQSLHYNLVCTPASVNHFLITFFEARKSQHGLFHVFSDFESTAVDKWKLRASLEERQYRHIINVPDNSDKG